MNEVHILKAPTQEDWDLCKQITLGTVGKKIVNPVDESWKRMMIASEHSPLRMLEISMEWTELPYWVSVHFCRHHVGVTPFVSTQRNDRQIKYDRNAAPQGSPVRHQMTVNYQAILTMSRARLCRQASKETREAWVMFLKELEKYEPILVEYCVPKCIYRNGLCGEPYPCGYFKREKEAYSYEYNRLFEKALSGKS